MPSPNLMYFSTQNDPCIIICLKEGAVHEALALPGAPVPQGPTVTESGVRFGQWLYDNICNAVPLTKSSNELFCNVSNNVSTHYREVLTGMNQDQLAAVEHHLVFLFAQHNPPAGSVPSWSIACEAQGLLLGHIFTVGKQGINLIFACLQGSSVDDQARNAIRGAVPTKACNLLGS